MRTTASEHSRIREVLCIREGFEVLALRIGTNVPAHADQVVRRGDANTADNYFHHDSKRFSCCYRFVSLTMCGYVLLERYVDDHWDQNKVNLNRCPVAWTDFKF